MLVERVNPRPMAEELALWFEDVGAVVPTGELAPLSAELLIELPLMWGSAMGFEAAS